MSLSPLKSRMATVRQTHEGEHHEDYGETPIQLSFALMAFTLSASLNACTLGYELGSSTRIGDLLQEQLDLTSDQRRFFIHCLPLFAMFTSLGASWYIADRVGRRLSFLMTSLTAIAGQVVVASAHSYTHLMLGRFILGCGIGLGLMVTPLYISELAPAKFRGWMVSWTEIGRISGLILGFNASIGLNGLPDSIQWRVMCLTGTTLPMVTIYVTTQVLPESPRWLMMRKRREEARAVLRDVYGPEYDVDRMLCSMDDALERDTQSFGANVPIWALLCRPGTAALQRMVLVGILAGCTQQALGYNALHYYVVDTVYNSGIQHGNFEDLVLVAIGFGNILYTFVGGRLLDTKGRRPLLFFSTVACGLVLLLFALTFLGSHEPRITTKVVAIVAFFTFYSFGLGPGSTVVASEVFATAFRAKGMALATGFNMLCGLGVSTIYPFLARRAGWESVFTIYGVCSLGVGYLYYKFLPETKMRSLECMPVYFAELTGDARVLGLEVELAKRRITVERGAQQENEVV